MKKRLSSFTLAESSIKYLNELKSTIPDFSKSDYIDFLLEQSELTNQHNVYAKAKRYVEYK